MTNIAVLGGGESGVGAALLASKKGLPVFLSDAGALKPKFRQELQDYSIAFEEGGHSVDRLMAADTWVKSPGIPDHLPLIQEAKAKGIVVMSEIEFASRFTDAFIVGITGSNGKTTTTMLCFHLLKKAGLNVSMVGNVGNSFARQVAFMPSDYYVIELSSFQLDGIHAFRPNIGILLNISPDHLDRYNYDFEAYAASKFRIAENQVASDYFLVCADDPETMQRMQMNQGKGRVLSFGWKGDTAKISNEEIQISTDNTTFNMSIHDLALQGKHNVHNSMAAGIAGKLLNLRQEVIRESLEDFQAVEHRLEPVLEVHGISFINDSKATNVNATWYALESMCRPVVWIVGGVDKGNDYHQLKDLVGEHVKAIVCLGKDNSKIHQAFESMVEVMVDAESMTEAVRMAYALGRKGDAVLLSPACASFDLFESYEDRGRQFKQAVKEL